MKKLSDAVTVLLCIKLLLVTTGIGVGDVLQLSEEEALICSRVSYLCNACLYLQTLLSTVEKVYCLHTTSKLPVSYLPFQFPVVIQTLIRYRETLPLSTN